MGDVAGSQRRSTSRRIIAAEPYFDVGPIECPGDGTYADLTAMLSGPSCQSQHSLSDVIHALAAAGLRIEFLHEFPFCGRQRLPSMGEVRDGFWDLPDRDELPFLFSLRARKAKKWAGQGSNLRPWD